ncbi:MAG: amidohydrolase family protein, partial [Bacteroidota bacterium]
MPTIIAQVADIFNRRIFPATVFYENGKIISIKELAEDTGKPQHFIIPGFTDAHVHIESSMLVPAEFAKLAVVHGTVSTISDP